MSKINIDVKGTKQNVRPTKNVLEVKLFVCKAKAIREILLNIFSYIYSLIYTLPYSNGFFLPNICHYLRDFEMKFLIFSQLPYF